MPELASIAVILLLVLLITFGIIAFIKFAKQQQKILAKNVIKHA